MRLRKDLIAPFREWTDGDTVCCPYCGFNTTMLVTSQRTDESGCYRRDGWHCFRCKGYFQLFVFNGTDTMSDRILTVRAGRATA